MDEMSASNVELLVNGIRIIMQILVDLHYNRLTSDVKKEIQQWYDQLQQAIEDDGQ